MSTGKIIAGIGAVVLIGFGVWAALPLFVNKEVNEAAPYTTIEQPSTVTATPTSTTSQGATGTPSATPSTAGAATVLGAGEFSGFDALHQASGTAQLIEVDGTHYVRFENNFTVTNGPDLYVHFGSNGEYAAQANLGRLKGNQGSQNYEVPAGIDPTQYDEVWVWCRAFSVPFGKAVLQ